MYLSFPLLLTVFTILQIVSIANAETPTSKFLLQQCEKYRNDNFNVGTAIIVQSDYCLGESNKDKILTTQKTSSWFDHGSLRTDCLDKAYFLQASACGSHFTVSRSENTAVTIGETRSINTPINEYLGLIHPMWLGTGYNSLSILNKGSNYRCVSLSNYKLTKEPNVTKEIIYGLEAFKISFSESLKAPVDPKELFDEKYNLRPNPVITKTKDIHTNETRWIIPDMGYALIKSISTADIPDDKAFIVNELNTSYSREIETGIWYPKESSHTSTNNGVCLTNSKAIIEQISFKKPDPVVFEVEGLGLKPGRYIHDLSQGVPMEVFIWDGKQKFLVP